MAANSSLISPKEANLPVTQLFTKKEIIGKGAYGAVYKAVHNSTGTAVAIKVIELDSPESAEEDILEIQREVALLSSIRDAERNNCTSYHGCWLMSTQLWLAMDLASGGSIRTIMKSTTLEERFVAVIMRETLVALVYLHKQGIIHRDIKAANVLLTGTGRIVLCDFGVAAHLQHGNNKRSTFIGTPYWMAPEVIADGKLYDTKADIWSLGVTCYECATGNPPYAQYEALRAIQLIPKNPPAKLDPHAGWSVPMREFLACCLNENPIERSSAEDLQKTKWMKSYAKTPVSVLKELITKYDGWLQSGGIRNSIIGIDDGPIPDDAWAPDSSWDYDSPMVDDNDAAYGGANLGTDLPYSTSEQRRPRASSKASTNPNHPLLRLFEQDETPAPLVSAAAAANAYGLGLGLNDQSAPVEPATKPSISIPNFGGDSDDEDTPAGSTNTIRNQPAQKAHVPLSEASTVRARPQRTLSSGSGASSSASFVTASNNGSSSSGTNISRAHISPSPKSTNLSLATRPSPPPPASPAVTTPIEGRMPFGLESSSNSPSRSVRSRANTLQQSPEEDKTMHSGVSDSPPRMTRPGLRRERTELPSSVESAMSSAPPSSSAVASKPTVTRAPNLATTKPASAAPIVSSSSSMPAKPILQNWADGPPIRSLNYASLGNTSDEVHIELERTVSDLSAWLAHLDGSLKNLLDATA